jgi:hypothetical protein
LSTQPSEFACADPTDKQTCQVIRRIADPSGNGGFYSSRDFGDNDIVFCYMPQFPKPTENGWRGFQVCRSNLPADFWGEVYVNGSWLMAPRSDPRCDKWGNRLSGGYLSCEAALPPRAKL